jgi:hypothetical protein
MAPRFLTWAKALFISNEVVIATQPPMVRATGQKSAWKPNTRSATACLSGSIFN